MLEYLGYVQLGEAVTLTNCSVSFFGRGPEFQVVFQLVAPARTWRNNWTAAVLAKRSKTV